MGAALGAACFTGGTVSGDAGADADDATVLPEPAALFSTSCATSGCHVGPDAPFHLNLTPGAYYANLVDVPANEVAGVMRVKPGSPTDTQSYLLCKVDAECTAVGQHMPFGASLTSAQVATLRSWVASLPLDDAGPPPGALDTTGPVFAGATSATPGPSSITLGWAPATDDVTPQSEIVYGIFESSTPGGETFGTPLAFTPPGATSYAVGPLPPNTTYYFVVLAFDWAHNDDGHDNIEVSATTPSAIDSHASHLRRRDERDHEVARVRRPRVGARERRRVAGLRDQLPRLRLDDERRRGLQVAGPRDRGGRDERDAFQSRRRLALLLRRSRQGPGRQRRRQHDRGHRDDDPRRLHDRRRAPVRAVVHRRRLSCRSLRGGVDRPLVGADRPRRHSSRFHQRNAAGSRSSRPRSRARATSCKSSAATAPASAAGRCPSKPRRSPPRRSTS